MRSSYFRKAGIAAAPFLIAAILFIAPLMSADGEWQFKAGAGAADITPDVKKWPVPMNGYGDRKKGPATGVHDHVYSKAIAMASVSPDGVERKALIVSVDLCMVTESLRKAVIERVKGLGYNDANFLFAATHTHSSTASIDTRWPVGLVMGKFNRELFDFTVDRIVASIETADAALAPARADVVQGSVPELVRNRRKDKYDYATRQFKGPRSPDIDATMSVLVIQGENDKPIAMMVVLGSHPTILGPDNMLISADWPGAMQRALEKKMGRGSVALFANGAEGDQAPEHIASKDDYDWAEKYGIAAAEAAFKLSEKSTPISSIRISAAVSHAELPRMKIKTASGIEIPKMLTQNINKAAIGLALIIGDAAFVGLPGEPLHKVGIELRDKARSKGVVKPVVIGLANDWIGYISDPASYNEGGYEANMTLYGPKESEICVANTLKALDMAIASY